MRLVLDKNFIQSFILILFIFSLGYFFTQNNNPAAKAETIETCFVCLYQDIPECSEEVREESYFNPWASSYRPMNKKECESKIGASGQRDCTFENGKCISSSLSECNQLKNTTYANYRSVVIERIDFLKRASSEHMLGLPGLEGLSCKNPIVVHKGHGQTLNPSCDKVSGCFSFMAPGGTLTFIDQSCETFKNIDRVKEAGEKLRLSPNYPIGSTIVFTANQAMASTSCASSFATLIIKPDNSSLTYDKCSKLGYSDRCSSNLCHKLFETATCADDKDLKKLKSKICCPPSNYARRIAATSSSPPNFNNDWLDASKSGQCPNLKEDVKAYCSTQDCFTKARKLCGGPLYNGYFKIDRTDQKLGLDDKVYTSYSCFVRN